MCRKKNAAAVLLGRRGGRVRSEIKERSSRNNGLLGGRPSRRLNAFEAARLAKKEDWRYSFFEFVDEFRRNPSGALCKRDPRVLGLESNIYALLQSTCLHLCLEAKVEPPNWLLERAFLPEPWFVSGMNNLYATAIQESPPAFRKNNIFVLSNFLNRC